MINETKFKIGDNVEHTMGVSVGCRGIVIRPFDFKIDPLAYSGLYQRPPKYYIPILFTDKYTKKKFKDWVAPKFLRKIDIESNQIKEANKAEDSEGRLLKDGDYVTINKRYGGGSGVIVDLKGPFIIVDVELPNGKTERASYHSSDVTLDEDYYESKQGDNKMIKIKKESSIPTHNSNVGAIEMHLNYCNQMVKFYSKDLIGTFKDENKGKSEYWNEYQKYIAAFKSGGYDISNIVKDSRFKTGGTQAAAKWIKNQFMIDMTGSDEFVTNVESKQIETNKKKYYNSVKQEARMGSIESKWYKEYMQLKTTIDDIGLEYAYNNLRTVVSDDIDLLKDTPFIIDIINERLNDNMNRLDIVEYINDEYGSFYDFFISEPWILVLIAVAYGWDENDKSNQISTRRIRFDSKQIKEANFKVGDNVYIYGGAITGNIIKFNQNGTVEVELQYVDRDYRRTGLSAGVIATWEIGDLNSELPVSHGYESKKQIREFSEVDRLWMKLPKALRSWVKSKYDVAKLTFSELFDIVNTYGPKFGYSESKQIKEANDITPIYRILVDGFDIPKHVAEIYADKILKANTKKVILSILHDILNQQDVQKVFNMIMDELDIYESKQIKEGLLNKNTIEYGGVKANITTSTFMYKGKEIMITIFRDNIDKDYYGGELYSGKNYILDSEDRSYSRNFKYLKDIPRDLVKYYAELITYHNKYFNDNISLNMNESKQIKEAKFEIGDRVYLPRQKTSGEIIDIKKSGSELMYEINTDKNQRFWVYGEMLQFESKQSSGKQIKEDRLSILTITSVRDLETVKDIFDDYNFNYSQEYSNDFLFTNRREYEDATAILDGEGIKYREESKHSEATKNGTFKCPHCGTKVLKNTGYCLKCKKKVKPSGKKESKVEITFENVDDKCKILYDNTNGDLDNYTKECKKFKMEDGEILESFIKFKYNQESSSEEFRRNKMIKKLVLEKIKFLKCVTPGRIEITSGHEARSADVYSGNILTITKEDKYRYYGLLDIGDSKFLHSPGFSGKKITDKTPFGSETIVFSVLKKYVNTIEDDFWATWEVE